jgi:V8-like Glu-specific endopeptidase
MARRETKSSARRRTAVYSRATTKLEVVDLQPPRAIGVGDPTVDRLGLRDALRGKPSKDLHVFPSNMTETYGGGSLETVPDFDVSRAITSGISHTGDVSWPQLANAACAPGAESAIFSPDGLRPESVVEKDTRRAVPNTAMVPWRCIALLRIVYVDGATGRGTGWFIGPKTLVTAAHCVFDRDHGAARTMTATPGFSHGAAPYGERPISQVHFNPAWKTTFDRELDFALVYTDTPGGTGSFGFSAASDAGLQSVLINIAGYPIDKSATQWYDAGRILSVDKNFIYHTIDTERGQSGAPLFWSDKDHRIGLGIHTYGASRGDRTNVARRITRELFDLFETRRL